MFYLLNQKSGRMGGRLRWRQPTQQQALRAIAVCRTAALGGHLDQCDERRCRRIAYCSCRSLHCPKCRGQARAQLLEQRAAELLPVEYFDVVFTVPQLVASLTP